MSSDGRYVIGAGNSPNLFLWEANIVTLLRIAVMPVRRWHHPPLARTYLVYTGLCHIGSSSRLLAGFGRSDCAGRRWFSAHVQRDLFTRADQHR